MTAGNWIALGLLVLAIVSGAAGAIAFLIKQNRDQTEAQFKAQSALFTARLDTQDKTLARMEIVGDKTLAQARETNGTVIRHEAEIKENAGRIATIEHRASRTSTKKR